MFDLFSPDTWFLVIVVATLLILCGLYRVLSFFSPWSEVRLALISIPTIFMSMKMSHLAVECDINDIASTSFFDRSIRFFAVLGILCLMAAMGRLVLRLLPGRHRQRISKETTRKDTAPDPDPGPVPGSGNCVRKKTP